MTRWLQSDEDYAVGLLSLSGQNRHHGGSSKRDTTKEDASRVFVKEPAGAGAGVDAYKPGSHDNKPRDGGNGKKNK